MRLVAFLVILTSVVGCSGRFNVAQSSPSANAFTSQQSTCGTSFAPAKVQTHLLSNDEYNNSVADLLYTKSIGSDLGIFEARPPGPSGFSNDTSSVQISDLTVSKYWDAADALANEVIKSKGVASGAYAKIASCAMGMTTVSSSCVDSVIRSLGRRAWRRPLSQTVDNNELARLKALVTSAADFDSGLTDVIKAILISPNFLFVSVVGPQATVAGATFSLNDYQIAARLSYFLWKSIPDDVLLDDAANGRLSRPDGLIAATKRMLVDPKIQRLSGAMANEWAHLANFANLPTPGLDESIKSAMETETRMMFNDVIRNDAKIADLIAAKSSFLNKALADYYGVPFSGADPAQFYKTSLAGTDRVGIFGQGSFLVLTAGSPTETHPVKRGKAIANDWVCSDIPPPPPNIMPAGDLSSLPANATPREVLAVHTASVTCRACHDTLDPYGLALETFDSFGKPRTVYSALGNRSIDPSGTLVSGYSFQSTSQLIGFVSGEAGTKSCLARKVMSLALARAASNGDDRCVAGVIAKSFVDSKFSDVVQAIVGSRQFLSQTGEAQ